MVRALANCASLPVDSVGGGPDQPPNIYRQIYELRRCELQLWHIRALIIADTFPRKTNADLIAWVAHFPNIVLAYDYSRWSFSGIPIPRLLWCPPSG